MSEKSQLDSLKDRISDHPFIKMRAEKGDVFNSNSLLEKIQELESQENDLVENLNCYKIKLGPRCLIEDIKFENVNFSKGEFKEITIKNCFFINCQFVGTKFENMKFDNCYFFNCYFLNPIFNDVYVHLEAFSECLNSKKHANLGVTLFQHLKNNFNDMDQPFLRKEADFLFMKWKRYQLYYEKKESNGNIQSLNYQIKIWVDLFYQHALGYGLKLRFFIRFTAIIYILFLIFNFLTWSCLGLNVSCETNLSFIQKLTDVIYYTTISLSNLGYGDITPTTIFGKLTSSFQAVVGAILFAVLASMLFKKFSR